VRSGFEKHRRVRITNEELAEIRRVCDREQLVVALGVNISQKKPDGDWWGHSPFTKEKTPSFHIQADGRWYCFSTNQGGGPIELVQRLFRLNCYEAGRWLLEHGVSTIQEETRAEAAATIAGERPAPAPNEANEVKEENQPIRQDLRPLLSLHHLEFERRAVPEEVLKELGIGYLDRPAKATRPDPLNRR